MLQAAAMNGVMNDTSCALVFEMLLLITPRLAAVKCSPVTHLASGPYLYSSTAPLRCRREEACTHGFESAPACKQFIGRHV